MASDYSSASSNSAGSSGEDFIATLIGIGCLVLVVWGGIALFKSCSDYGKRLNQASTLTGEFQDAALGLGVDVVQFDGTTLVLRAYTLSSYNPGFKSFSIPSHANRKLGAIAMLENSDLHETFSGAGTYFSATLTIAIEELQDKLVIHSLRGHPGYGTQREWVKAEYWSDEIMVIVPTDNSRPSIQFSSLSSPS
jgi:hypothetical protein